MRRFALLSLALFLFVTAQPARAESTETNPPLVPVSTPQKKLKKIAYRLRDEVTTLDWNRAHTAIDASILNNLMEGLVGYDEKMNLVPSLAENWTVSEDRVNYTFRLRPGLKWSDGVPVKAEDFVYSWKRLLSPGNSCPYAYLLFDIDGAEYFNKGKLQDFSAVGISAPDERTLKVRLARPVAHWLNIPAVWVTFPLRKDIVEKYGNEWTKPGRLVSLGPYRIVQHDLHRSYTLQRNPYYHGARGNLDEISLVLIPDDADAVRQYENKQLDLIPELSIKDVDRLKGRPDIRTFALLRSEYIGLVVDRYPLSDVRFRKAIAMSIDRQKLMNFLHWGQKTASSFVAPGVLGYSTAVGLPFNPSAARALLQQIGIDPARIKVDLLTRNWDKELLVARFIQDELKRNLGITVQYSTLDHRSFRAQLDLRSHSLYQNSWVADFPDPDNFLSSFLSSSGVNKTGWKSAEYDEKVLSGRNLSDTKARERAYVEAQRILQEKEVAIVPLYYGSNTALVRPNLRNVQISPTGDLLLKRVSIDE